MGAESGLPQDWLQADAAGEDHGDTALVRLDALSQPAQEFVHRLPSLRGDAVVVSLEQSVDEDWQLVDREHHRPVVSRQRRQDRVASLPPISSVDPGPQLHPYVGNGQRIDSVADLAQCVGER